MASHWFLQDKHMEFRDSITFIFNRASEDICRSDGRTGAGDEDTQCQHLFTKIYTLMQERSDDLTKKVLCCSKIPDPVVELRYYRSRVKRSKEQLGVQFIEKETGADFVLIIDINFPGTFQAQRSVLGQAKILVKDNLVIDNKQLQQLLRVGGPESAAYLIWADDQLPTVITAENIAAFVRTQGANTLRRNIFAFGQPLSEFFSEAFIGLWFGKDYDAKKENENPPETSIAILYHFLHQGVPPPNVVYFGLMSSQKAGIRPGVYIRDVVDLDGR